MSVIKESLKNVTEKLAEMKAALDKLEKDLEKAATISEEKKHAFFYKDTIFTDMSALRAPADALEMMVDKKMWPLPTYGDMLFEV